MKFHGHGQRPGKPRRFARVMVLAASLIPIASLAGPLTHDFGLMEFATSGQSMWGPGASTTLDESFFLGSTWDASASVGGITGREDQPVTVDFPHFHSPSGWHCHGFLCSGGHFHNPGGIHIHTVDTGLTVDTRTGAEATLGTDGKVGFNFGAQIDSGSVAATVDFSAKAVLPDPDVVDKGEFFNLNPESTFEGGQLDTNLAEASAKMEAVLGVRASIDGQACLPPFGCTSGEAPIGFPDQTVELISFNDVDSPGQIKVLGALDPALFQFDSEISIPSPTNPLGSVGGVTIHIPDINASGGLDGDKLTASGMDDFIKLTVDLDGLILAPAGLPGLGVNVSAGIISASADLVDIDMGPIIELIQEFELTPTLYVDLQFDRPVMIAGRPDPVFGVTSPWNMLPDMALLFDETIVTPTFFVEAMFSNDTLLGIDGIFQLDVLKASLALEAFGLSFDLGSVGPLFQELQRTNLFDSPPLFSNDYLLGGFNQIVGAPFLIRLEVLEPGTFALFALGVAALGTAGRRKRSLTGLVSN